MLIAPSWMGDTRTPSRGDMWVSYNSWAVGALTDDIIYSLLLNLIFVLNEALRYSMPRGGHVPSLVIIAGGVTNDLNR